MITVLIGCTKAPVDNKPTGAQSLPQITKVALVDKIGDLEPVALSGTLPENAIVSVYTPEIAGTKANSIMSYPTGAFSWTGTIPGGSKLVTLVGVGDSPPGIFTLMGVVPPITKYGPPEGITPDKFVFKITVNGALAVEKSVSRADLSKWTTIDLDLSMVPGNNTKLVFSVEGILVGRVLPYWGDPQFISGG